MDFQVEMSCDIDANNSSDSSEKLERQNYGLKVYNLINGYL